MKTDLQKWLLNLPFVAPYDDDDGDAGDDGDDGDSGSNEGDSSSSENSGNDAAFGDPSKTFTQTELNTILKRERKKQEDKTRTQIKELEQLKKSKSMTEQDRAKLSSQIDTLQSELLTKEQLAAREKEKLKKQHGQQIDQVTKERDSWQQRYRSAEINRAISDAASSEGAFASRDIQALLSPNTSLQEDMDDNGSPKGSFTPKVKFLDSSKDGKPVTLDLTVSDAVKRMKDTPEKYGHLFKSTASSGLGESGGAGRGTAQDVSKM